MGRSVYKSSIIRFLTGPRLFLEKIKRKLFIFLFLGIFPLLTLLYFFRKSPDNNQLLLPEEYERPLESVAALGQISPAGETRLLAAPSLRSGSIPRISELLVEEGDKVFYGQVLAIFDNQGLLLADLEIAKTRLKTIQENILFQARNVARYEEASLYGAAPLSVLDKEKDILSQLQGRANELNSEIRKLEFDLTYTKLLSPIDGIVLKVNYREGERPGNDGVLQIASTKSMEALIEVYESDINRVSLGQNVILISENGGFDGNLLGTVSRISPKIQQRAVLSTDPTGDADARIVNVRVTLEKESSNRVRYFTGMKVIAKFE